VRTLNNSGWSSVFCWVSFRWLAIGPQSLGSPHERFPGKLFLNCLSRRARNFIVLRLPGDQC